MNIPHRTLTRYEPARIRDHVENGPSSTVQPEDARRVRLPGLFRWEEVSALFMDATGYDSEWHFVVRVEGMDSRSEPLYSVHAVLRARVSDLSERIRARRAGKGR